MQQSEIEILLKKYINQTCTEEELVFVLNYTQLPEGRKALEELLLADWNNFEADEAKSEEAQIWLERLNNSPGKQPIVSTWSRYKWLKYAAILIILTGFGVWFISNWHTDNPKAQNTLVEKYNPPGQRSQITLHDGSIVYLGADSRLRYPERLSGNVREIYLEGEAFFEVKHDVKRPFIVYTGKIQTQVLGTSFKIEAFKNHELSVAVATGKVSVGYKEQNEKLRSLAVLTPGRKIYWNPLSSKLETKNLAVQDVKGWKDGNLAFTDARLDDIALELERWYNTRIIIKGHQIGAYSLSLNIDGKSPITSALDAITSGTGLKYKIDQNQIMISRK